ncbi:MAG: hypothetical protein HOH33_07210 [Verrucomicrobia bacterium]|jgi:hypothetical protein|nr:hypothetical protein [Verrucomicrobiota bacterium]
MSAKAFKRFLLFAGVSAIILLALATLWVFISLQANPAKSLASLAKPFIKMDLQAPQEHGWLSDHEIFFLREKNQCDFLCIKKDVRDGSESVMEALSPFLQDHEDRGKYFELKPSPSGKKLALIMGSHTNQIRILHEWENEQTIELKKGEDYTYDLTWLPDESGWVAWKPKIMTKSDETHISLDPHFFTASTSVPNWNTLNFPFFPSPPYVLTENGNLTVLCFDEILKRSKQGLSLYITPLQKQTPNLSSKKHLMIPNMMVTRNSFVSNNQNGNLWLITHDHWSFAWRIHRTQTFPYMRIQTTQLTLKLWNFKTNTSTILDPDVEIKNVGNFKLNPSGTHFSFTYQGQIWVAKVADFQD